ncbi:MAG: hypothetical protein DCC71_16980 [Proteobacteria bacterium]|nr:MAG: hypothetical protein DCC71_16980 [Pseudomonadota bacterium]
MTPSLPRDAGGRVAPASRRLAVPIAACACLLASAPAPRAVAAECASGDARFHKGFTLGGWSRDDYDDPRLDAQIAELARAGVEWVALTPRWMQQRTNSTELAPHPERSPSDASVVRAIRAVRRHGMRVFLKPQVDVVADGWRGEIAFASEADWAAWFRSYARFALHYARLARDEGVDLLSVGVELDATRHRERDWRELIASLRPVFPRSLVYAANWGRERDVAWWDALDYAGVDAYFPLASAPDPSLDALRAAWLPHLRELRAWAGRICKQVIFTELGYRSVRGASARPWEWEQAGPPAHDEQARLYRAALDVFWEERWLGGLYWWQWRTAPPHDAAADTDYTPQDKPAWSVLREFYAREAPCVPAPCR